MSAQDNRITPGQGGYAVFPPMSATGIVVTLLVVVALSVSLRLHYFSDFSLPINDGGLFYAYATAILDHKLTLPTVVEFNGFTLPFSYPPFSFWLVALLTSGFDLDLMGVVKYYPFAVNLLFLFLYVPLLRALRLPWSTAALAGAIFFLSHRSFEYLIMGGGVSRSTGAVFALAALIFAAGLTRRHTLRRTIGAALCCALAILSHLEWGVVSALGITLILLTYGENRRIKIVQLLQTGTMTALLIAPWLVWIYHHHGMDPFIHASQTSFWNFEKSLFSILRLDIFPWYLKLFCVIGVWESLKNRQYFWIGFTLSLALLTPRHFDTAAVISNSVLAAVGIFHIWRLLLAFVERVSQQSDRLTALVSGNAEKVYPVLILLTAMFTATASYYQLGRASMGTLSPEAYGAMRWIRKNVEQEARFVVISPDPWYIDEVNEWFPLIAGANSLTTVQGTEWVAGGEFSRRCDKDARLKHLPCPYIADYLINTYGNADYILAVSRRECLRSDDRFVPVYANSGTDVYRIHRDKDSRDWINAVGRPFDIH